MYMNYSLKCYIIHTNTLYTVIKLILRFAR